MNATAKVSILAGLACAALLAGCRAKSEFDGQTYRQNGMDFSIAVPQGWSYEELDGDLMLQLAGPAVGTGRVRPMIHVFSRRESAPVDLDQAAQELQKLLTEQWRFDPTQPKTGPSAQPIAIQPADVSGLPARSMARTVREGAAMIHQQLIVVARGRQDWALLVAMPEGADAATQQAADEIRRSFKVW